MKSTGAGSPKRRGAARGARPNDTLANRAPLDRPLRSLPHAALIARFQAAVRAGEGVAGAHCAHELWMRGELVQNVERALTHLWRAAAATIPEWLPMQYVSWLPAAYEVAARFRPRTKGRSNVYLILLDYSDRRGDPHGAYVGMSRYTPMQRFEQHKAGLRSAGSVLKRGLEVLAGPTLHLQRIARPEAERIEAALAAALSDAGIRVEGGH